MSGMNETAERYKELARLYEDGFFDDVRDFEEEFFGKDGKFLVEKLYRLWSMFSFGKNTLKYYLIHREMMPTFGTPGGQRSAEELEALYRECLEKGQTWKEHTGYREAPEGVLY